MQLTNAKYVKSVLSPEQENSIVKVTIDGVVSWVPTDPANTDYAEILRQVEAGTLTIAPADEE